MFPLNPFQIFAIVNRNNLRGPAVLNQGRSKCMHRFIFYVFPMTGSLREADVEESSRPACDAVWNEEQFPMLQRILVRSGSSSLRRTAVLLGLLNPEYKCTLILGNAELLVQ